MEAIRISETFRTSHIDYAIDVGGIIRAYIDHEPMAMISGKNIHAVRAAAFARIKREAN